MACVVGRRWRRSIPTRAARCSGSSTTACARWSAAPATRGRRAPGERRRRRRGLRADEFDAHDFLDAHPGLWCARSRRTGWQRAVRGPADQRVHRAGRVGWPGRARVGRAGPVPGRRAHERVAGGHVRERRGRRRRAPARQRTGHGEHIDFSIAEVMTIAANSYAEYMRACSSATRRSSAPTRTIETPSVEPTLDGYVGFCTNSREQFHSFLLLIERARSHRRRPFGNARRSPERLGRVERHRPRVDPAAHHRGDRAPGERAAHPGRAGAQRREHPRVRPLRRPQRLRRRRDGLVQDAASPVAHGRRRPAAAAPGAAPR